MLKHRTIQEKLLAVILATSSVVLLLSYSAYFAYEYYSYKKETSDQLSTIGRMIAANSSAALAFDNAPDAEEVLGSLQLESHILAGAIYNESGKVFARYIAASDSTRSIPQTVPEFQGNQFDGTIVSRVEPVMHQGKRLGTLYLVADISIMYARFTLYFIVGALILLISFLVALILSKKLQKTLSQPIMDLASTAHRISENADYSTRVKKRYNDEVGLLTDAFNKMLTQIEHQDQEIKRFNQELEAKVADRTAEIKQAYQEMEAFSYMVSHDLNAPLRHIDSYLEIYFERYGDQLDDGAKKTLSTVMRNARKMKQLIEDLLAFSQLGRKDLERSRIPMLDMVNEIVAEHKKIEITRSIIFDVKILPDAFGDAILIRQVWENLISNAIKYTGQNGEAKVRVGFEMNRDTITYSVEDNGAGFDMKDYSKLFNPFQRLHNQTQFEGTGVGLAIVKRIVNKHGGEVWAESRVNEGATFYFSLPKKA